MADDKDAEKVASKGISKRTNKFHYNQYKKVCYQNETFDATNYSIKVQNEKMCTIKSLKRGLAGVHVKSFVQEDKVTTIPHKKLKL